MSILPDELWRRILEIGIETSRPESDSKLSYKDLCCLSITCRQLNRLSGEDSYWSSLLSSDFPNYTKDLGQSSSSNHNCSSKTVYKVRFERDRERKLLAHRRAVLRVESKISEHSRKLREIEQQSVDEREKLKATVAELSNLRMVRQASVALNVWQPAVIRGKQKQIVEQCVVPVESRFSALEMELKLCKQQIAGLDKAHRDEKRRLEDTKEELASVKYHPLQDHCSKGNNVGERGLKRKKLKKT